MAESVSQDQSSPAGAGSAVWEPTLYFSAYVHKHLPGFVEEDPRLVVLTQVDRFVDIYALKPELTGEWRNASATGIDLVAVHRSPLGYLPLFNAQRRPDAKDPDYYTCLVYAHLDSLVVQIMITKLDQADTLLAGWLSLRDKLRAGFDGGALEEAKLGALGASTVYWAMTGDHSAGRDAYKDEVGVITTGLRPRCTETDIGLLWRSELPILLGAPTVSQDHWILITPDTKEAEREVNARYSQVRTDRPCPFAVVALAGHKVSFERAQYEPERHRLAQERRNLDRRARWIIDQQAFHGEGLSRLRSPNSLEFQQKLARAHRNLADFSHTATRVKELRRTVNVNRVNFLTNCPALVSAAGAADVASSVRQDEAAKEFLATWQQTHLEEVFRSELGRMQSLSDQLDVDVDYSEQLIRRHSVSLRSGSEQLQIAGERELGEISEHHALEAAAVVASLAAIVTLELLRLGDALEEEPGLSANVILLAVTGSFALVQLLRGGGHATSKLQRASFAATVGFAAATLATLAWGWLGLVANLGIVLVVAGGAWATHSAVEATGRARRRRQRQEAEQIVDDLEKLAYAGEELPLLLEDLPPTTTYRKKDKASLTEKVRRKNVARALELGISEDELLESGRAYTVRDATDAIGIRYVAGPSALPEIVDRVKAVTHPEKIEYKNDGSVIGDGRYRGFRMKYKSVHIDVDLWGVGARKDVNLVAEIQVRTRLQNLFANWFHDVMYKPSPPDHDVATTSGGWRAVLGLPLRPFRRMAQCARRARDEKRGGGSVSVTERDDSIALASGPITTGSVTFTVKNEGELGHDLAVEGPGLEGVRTGVLAPDSQETLTVSLRQGEHTLYCSLDGQTGVVAAAPLAVGARPTAPWLVLFFDLWHPWLNRPLARTLIWLTDLELWLFRRRMEWRGD